MSSRLYEVLREATARVKDVEATSSSEVVVTLRDQGFSVVIKYGDRRRHTFVTWSDLSRWSEKNRLVEAIDACLARVNEDRGAR